MEHKRGMQDYLRTIYELEENGVKSIEIAKKLKISKASVSEMLRKLKKEDLISIKPYSKILLTKKGKQQAEKYFDKYYTIKRFVKRFLNHNDEKATEEAHKLEHAFSEDSIIILNKILDENKENLFLPNYVG